MSIKGIIFDYDGTLVDSMLLWRNLDWHYLCDCGRTPDFEPHVRAKGHYWPDYIAENLAFGETKEQINARLTRILQCKYREEILPKPGVDETLRRFGELGIRCCVATATDIDIMYSSVERLGWDRRLDFVLDTKTVGADKTKPDVYFAALNRLGLRQDEVLVFEDALYAAKTASKAGFRVVGIEDPCMAGDADELRRICTYYLCSYDELLCNAEPVTGLRQPL